MRRVHPQRPWVYSSRLTSPYKIWHIQNAHVRNCERKWPTVSYAKVFSLGGLAPNPTKGFTPGPRWGSTPDRHHFLHRQFLDSLLTGTKIHSFGRVLFDIAYSFFTALQTRYSDENSVRLSVRPSVRLSHAWIVTKRRKDVSRFLYHTKDNLA